jgi:hypothetical protein
MVVAVVLVTVAGGAVGTPPNDNKTKKTHSKRKEERHRRGDKAQKPGKGRGPAAPPSFPPLHQYGKNSISTSSVAAPPVASLIGKARW